MWEAFRQSHLGAEWSVDSFRSPGPPTSTETDAAIELLASGRLQQSPLVDYTIYALARLGSDPLPNLGRAYLLAEEPLSHNICEAFSRIGPEAVAYLASSLDPGGGLRNCATEALAQISRGERGFTRGKRPLEAIEPLRAALGNEDSNVVRAALGALRIFGPSAADAASSALPLLRASDVRLRRPAARFFWRLGTGAATAKPQLIAALGDEDLLVREFAALALGNLGRMASDALPALLAKLDQPAEDPPGYELVGVPWAIGRVGDGSEETVAKLREALLSPHEDVRGRAMCALAGLGPAAKAATPALIAPLREREEEYAWLRMLTLARFHFAGLVETAELVRQLGPANKRPQR